MGKLSEKGLRFVVFAVQERCTRADVLFVFFKTKVLFVTGKKKHLKPRFFLVEKGGVVVSQLACPGCVSKDSLTKPLISQCYAFQSAKHGLVCTSVLGFDGFLV